MKNEAYPIGEQFKNDTAHFASDKNRERTVKLSQVREIFKETIMEYEGGHADVENAGVNINQYATVALDLIQCLENHLEVEELENHLELNN